MSARQLLKGFEFNDAEWANIEEYAKVFDSYDKSGDGKMDAKEINGLLATSKANPKPTAQQVLEATDVDGDGTVSKREFLLGITGCSQEAKYQCMFNTFDKDNDGRISCSEVLESLGSEVSAKGLATAKKLIAELDRDGDGFLDPTEFARKFSKKQTS